MTRILIAVLLSLIAYTAHAQRVYTFPTIKDAAMASYIGIGSTVITEGYHSFNDGGGALYRMTAIASAPMAADSGYVYPVTATKVLVQVLEGEYLESATYGVKCGDSGAAAANYSRLQRYFNAIDTLDKQAHINGCNDTIYVAFSSALTVNLASHDKFVMRGDGADVTRIKASSGTLAFTFSDNAKVNLFDLYLHGYDATVFGGIGGLDQSLTIDSTASTFTIGINGGNSVSFSKSSGSGTDDQTLSIDSTAGSYTVSIEDGNSVTFAKGGGASNAPEYLDTLTHIYTNRRMPYYDKKRSNAERVIVGIIGDSNTELDARFVTPIRNKFAAAGFTVGPAYYDIGNAGITKSTWELSVGNSVSGGVYAGLSGDTARLNSVTFDTVVITMNGAGVYDVYIDNDSIRRITVAGFRIDTIPTTLASHSLSIRVVSDSVSCYGFALRSTSADIQIYNFGLSGATSATFAGIDSAEITAQLLAYGVDATFINLGTNDFSSRTAAQYIANISTIVDNIQGAGTVDMCLVSPAPGNGGTTQKAIAYRDSIVALANREQLNYLSLYDLHGDAAGAVARGIQDGVHYQANSYKIHGDVFYAFLVQRSPVVTASTSEFAYPITTYLSDGSTTVDFATQESGVFRINMGSTTYDSLTFSNPFTTGAPQYLLHFSNVATDTIFFPSNVISYAGDTLRSRIVTSGFAANLYYDGTNYYTQDTFGTLNTTPAGGGGGGESFLLDTYTGAEVAWSFRQLKSGITHVMRARRKTDNAEKNFTAAGVTDSLATWAAGDSAWVVSMYDQSGNGRTLTATGTTTQAVIVAGGTLLTNGGRAEMDLDGPVDAGYTFTAISMTDMYLLWVGADDPLVATTFFSNSATAGSTFTVSPSLNTVELQQFDGGGSFSFTDVPNDYLVSLTRVSSSTNCFVNGVASTSNPRTHNNTFAPNRLGLRGGNKAATRVQEVIVWSTNHSAERSAIESNVNAYYSVY